MTVKIGVYNADIWNVVLAVFEAKLIITKIISTEFFLTFIQIKFNILVAD